MQREIQPQRQLRGVEDHMLWVLVVLLCVSMFMEPLLLLLGDSLVMRSSRSESSEGPAAIVRLLLGTSELQRYPCNDKQ